jgi:hypothetical protein
MSSVLCGYNRKYAVRILNHPPSVSSKRHVGRKPVYRSDEYLTALKRIWFASDQMCSKKQLLSPCGCPSTKRVTSCYSGNQTKATDHQCIKH